MCQTGAICVSCALSGETEDLRPDGRCHSARTWKASLLEEREDGGCNRKFSHVSLLHGVLQGDLEEMNSDQTVY